MRLEATSVILQIMLGVCTSFALQEQMLVLLSHATHKLENAQKLMWMNTLIMVSLNHSQLHLTPARWNKTWHKLRKLKFLPLRQIIMLKIVWLLLKMQMKLQNLILQLQQVVSTTCSTHKI